MWRRVRALGGKRLASGDGDDDVVDGDDCDDGDDDDFGDDDIGAMVAMTAACGGGGSVGNVVDGDGDHYGRGDDTACGGGWWLWWWR